MKRQYQFSIDSFQILLDSLLNRSSPHIWVRSSYGNIFEAFHHLHHRLIAVKAPEELRGGGLLKYCDLIARGFRPSHQSQMKELQRYMCSRFFIDFRHSSTQEQVLFNYVSSHFGSDFQIRHRFLRCLYEVASSDRLSFGAFERLCFLRTISMMFTMFPTKVNRSLRPCWTPTSMFKSKNQTEIPSVPKSNEFIQNSSDQSNGIVLLPSFSIDIFVEIVENLRTELFPKLNQFLSTMLNLSSTKNDSFQCNLDRSNRWICRQHDD